MIAVFTRAFLQLRDPILLRVILMCVLTTIIVYVALFLGLGWALRNTTFFALPWMDTLADLGAGVAAGVLAWLLFPGVVTGIMGLMLDDVVAAVESRHYSHIGPPRPVPLTETLKSSAKLVGLTVGLNLLLLPLYIVLIFVPPMNLVLFYLVNGRLLGREYFEAVALRRGDETTTAALRGQFRWSVLGAGAITTFLLTIPVINLVAPVIGAAAMVHLFHKLTVRV
jgi:CysZ protein